MTTKYPFSGTTLTSGRLTISYEHDCQHRDSVVFFGAGVTREDVQEWVEEEWEWIDALEDGMGEPNDAGGLIADQVKIILEETLAGLMMGWRMPHHNLSYALPGENNDLSIHIKSSWDKEA